MSVTSFDLFLAAMIGFAVSIILAGISIASVYRFSKTRYIQFLYLSLEWTGLLTWTFLTSLSNFLVYLGESPPLIATVLGYIGYYALIPATFFLILFVDSISRNAVDPRKILFFAVVATLSVLVSLIPIQMAKVFNEPTYIVSAVIWSFRSFLWTYYAIKVYLNSPKNLKSKSLVFLIGTVFSGIITSFFILTRIVTILNEISFMIGVFLVAIALTSESKLLYILPFRTSRIAIVNEGGIPLFTYSWVTKEKKYVNDAIFSGMMSGISQILQDSLRSGNIREITLDNSVMLLERAHNYPITFILVSSKSSKSLTKALNLFVKEFTGHYGDSLTKKVIVPAKYAGTSDLVSQCFPFLPEYE